jgi:serine/threonine protein kinase
MLNSSGQPILMDFGVAKIMGGKQFTATGAVIGTPAYIAPELVRGNRPDNRADIYSLGIMLYEMLAGQLPFDADSAMTLMLKHLSEPPPDLHLLAPHVSHPMVTVVERALEKDPNLRFQTAADFAQALRDAMAGKATSSAFIPPGLTTAPVGASGRNTLPPNVTPPPMTAPIATPVREGRSNNMPIILGMVAAAGLCVFLAVAVIAGSLFFNQFGGAQTPTRAIPTTQVALIATATSPLIIATDTDLPPTPTQFAPETPTEAPTAELTPTEAPTLAPTNTPATLYASITDISIVNGRYSVSFQTFNYQSALPGQHIHLYFDTVPQSQAGAPGSGPWFVHGAGSPVSPYAVSERPAGATSMCILVANPDHTIILNSGNCVPLPQG